MGWFEEQVPTTTTEKAYIAEILRTTLSGTVLALALVNHVAYIAYQPPESTEVVALVFALRRRTKRSDWGRSVRMAYKPMDETVGPVQQECPARILDLLTPTEHAHSNTWRAACRAALAARQSTPQILDGTRLRFTEPIRFRDGTTRDTFTLRRTAHRRQAWFDAGTGIMYIIRGWTKLVFTVIEDDPGAATTTAPNTHD